MQDSDETQVPSEPPVLPEQQMALPVDCTDEPIPHSGYADGEELEEILTEENPRMPEATRPVGVPVQVIVEVPLPEDWAVQKSVVFFLCYYCGFKKNITTLCFFCNATRSLLSQRRRSRSW